MLHVAYATAPAPGGVNEDYVIAGPAWVAVLDGATAPRGVESGCEHGVPWLVRTLARALVEPVEAGDPLPEALSRAITVTKDAHGGTCDLGNPHSPSSTVAIVRRAGEHLEYLVLCDSPVGVLHTDGTLDVVDDDRIGHLPGGRPYSLDLVASQRNRRGGFWVAGADPGAAFEALTGSVPAAGVRAVGMFTDGVTRLVEWYGRSWEALMAAAAAHGPARLLAEVREAESAHGTPGHGKPHDDATAVWISLAPPGDGRPGT
ncbi:protein phosphatase 2C domain-containing protein [Nonomuraea muscovyensis]|uniref:PPM-type phosphatase domain-containing protein n=1 Tax=Nonomuraea muscovyensis TaxID=1124761 RepID=A0A7X0C443_9ACTN|nr:protein phosphatase 2C domain-containing protein [Nonomuraea muscovyensis]MBB6348163.1 hypothetical protein [Nonomuraea muscovyensis]MDF2710518.1 hypothetical protein [Nonomuraea muscovyensis]